MCKGGRTTCILCSKPAVKVIVSSAPMETPISSRRQRLKQSPRSPPSPIYSEEIPAEIQRRLPSLTKIRPLIDAWDANVSINAGNPAQRFVKQALALDLIGSDELSCRLAVAQILKDVDFPREPMPSYVLRAAGEVLQERYRQRTEDIVDLLLSLSST